MIAKSIWITVHDDKVHLTAQSFFAKCIWTSVYDVKVQQLYRKGNRSEAGAARPYEVTILLAFPLPALPPHFSVVRVKICETGGVISFLFISERRQAAAAACLGEGWKARQSGDIYHIEPAHTHTHTHYGPIHTHDIAALRRHEHWRRVSRTPITLSEDLNCMRVLETSFRLISEFLVCWDRLWLRRIAVLYVVLL